MSKGENRSAARLAAVQALYQMDVTGKGIVDILAEFEAHWIGREIEGAEYKPAEIAYFRNILEGVLADQIAIDREVDTTLSEGWPLKRIEAVMRAILRAGVFELMKKQDVPIAVIVTEYVDIAKAFYEAEEPGLVNAVLDRVAGRVRTDTKGRAR